MQTQNSHPYNQTVTDASYQTMTSRTKVCFHSYRISTSTNTTILPIAVYCRENKVDVARFCMCQSKKSRVSMSMITAIFVRHKMAALASFLSMFSASYSIPYI